MLAHIEIRDKWATGEVRVFVEWLIPQATGLHHGSREWASYDFVEYFERPDASHLKLEERVTRTRLSFIIAGSEAGIPKSGKFALLFASRSDAARSWPWLVQEKNKRVIGQKLLPGAPSKYDWEGALIEAALFIQENRLPKRKATLVNHILEWFGENGPSESQVKEHIGRLFDAFHDASVKSARKTLSKKKSESDFPTIPG